MPRPDGPHREHALKLHFAFAVFGDDEEGCGRLVEQLHSSITKTLFE